MGGGGFANSGNARKLATFFSGCLPLAGLGDCLGWEYVGLGTGLPTIGWVGWAEKMFQTPEPRES